MKRTIVLAVIFTVSVLTAATALHYRAEAKQRERAEIKVISDGIDQTMQETIRTLDEMPKIGK